MSGTIVPRHAVYRTEAGRDFFEASRPEAAFYSKVKSVSLQIDKSTEDVGVLKIVIQDNELEWGDFFLTLSVQQQPETLIMFLGELNNLRRVFHGQMRLPPIPAYDKEGNVQLTFTFYGQFSRKKGDISLARQWPLVPKEGGIEKVITLHEIIKHLSEVNNWEFKWVPAEGELEKILYSPKTPLYQKAESSDYQFIVETCSSWNLGVTLKYTGELGTKFKLDIASFGALGTPLLGAEVFESSVLGYLGVMHSAVVNRGIVQVEGNHVEYGVSSATVSISRGADGTLIAINEEGKQIESGEFGPLTGYGLYTGTRSVLVDHEFIVAPATSVEKLAIGYRGGAGVIKHRVHAISGMTWKHGVKANEKAYRQMIRAVGGGRFENISRIVAAFSKLKVCKTKLLISPQDFILHLFGVKSETAKDLDFYAIFGSETEEPAPVYSQIAEEPERIKEKGDHYLLEMTLTCDGNECIAGGQWGMVTGFTKWVRQYVFYISAVTHNLGSQQFTTSVTLQVHGIAHQPKELTF